MNDSRGLKRDFLMRIAQELLLSPNGEVLESDDTLFKVPPHASVFEALTLPPELAREIRGLRDKTPLLLRRRIEMDLWGRKGSYDFVFRNGQRGIEWLVIDLEAGQAASAAAPAPAADLRMIRLDYLRSVTGNDEAQMIELMDIFLDDVPPAIEQMESLCRGLEWPALKALAHKTKANFRYIGAERLFQLTDTIEQFARRAGHGREIPVLIAQLRRLSQGAIDALRLARAELMRGR